MTPDTGPATGDELLVLQWNILADRLAASGGFLRTAPEDLSWEIRCPRILDEILDPRGNGRSPDVVCLQEVDHFEDGLAPALEAHGYHGRFFAKAPGRDGLALFWSAARFPEARVELLRYTDPEDGSPQSQIAALAELKRREGGTLRVATTHLKAKSGHEGVRAGQVTELLAALADTDGPLVVAGDFNDVPDSPAHALVRTHPLGLTSSYAALLAADEPEWTTWKVREAGEVRRTIDYLWHSPGLQAVATLSIPLDRDIGPVRLPSDRYPSDHLALLARYRFRDGPPPIS